ncbi:thioredoxin domain-containing protein [Sulfolobus sp. S-194]|uniref:thioredoxin domain-containing protein n=1 Tax=Sulfolobus sp. S-194 TaxID=2512240 RepID=UPI0014370756|nr:thioredoxin domain-containing protein [Sulfolobus sp. S-194]QIW25072.1 thioredoxin domain-containing protein [Sulfolobus sp. S-194]
MNRLKESKSAFLLQAVNSPINWYPWGEEAFERAKREDKPVLVDVGASWCHWCHVMDEETYNDPEVVKIINENFIAIKVDRDELPDLDRELQNLVSTITGESGWPLTVFMTPDKKVFFGGTYFPPEDRYGRIGFKRLLREILRVWKEDRQKILEVVKATSSLKVQFNIMTPEWEVVENSISSIVSVYDFENGGLQGEMKFPHPTVDELLLGFSFYSGSDTERKLSLFTLKKMFYGGIFDQVGGGFHRYTVDNEWYVPHFEKLLIDNAELLLDYLQAYQLTQDIDILDCLRLTYNFLVRDMKTEVGFANSLDADSEGIEGYYYTWSENEFFDALKGEDIDFWSKFFNLKLGKEVEGRKVLRRTIDSRDLAKYYSVEKLTEIRNRLLEYREKSRKKPFRDENLYTYPNSRVAEALLYAYPILKVGLNEALEIVNKLSKNVTRRLEGGKEGLLEDYASSTLALIAAYEVTGNDKYKDLALSLSQALRDKEGYVLDSPNESPESLRMKALIKLSQITEEKIDVKIYESSPAFTSGVLFSVMSFLKGIAHIVIVDEKDSKAEELHNTALTLYYPMKVVELIDDSKKDYLPSYMRSMINYNKGVSRAFVCIRNKCSMPIISRDKLKTYLGGIR